MPNIYHVDRLYRRKVIGSGTTGETLRLDLGPVKPKTLRVLTHVTVENTENAYTRVRLGIENRGVIHYLDELTDPAKEELAVSRSDILLGEGDVFFAQCVLTEATNVLEMNAIGWELTLK